MKKLFFTLALLETACFGMHGSNQNQGYNALLNKVEEIEYVAEIRSKIADDNHTQNELQTSIKSLIESLKKSEIKYTTQEQRDVLIKELSTLRRCINRYQNVTHSESNAKYQHAVDLVEETFKDSLEMDSESSNNDAFLSDVIFDIYRITLNKLLYQDNNVMDMNTFVEKIKKSSFLIKTLQDNSNLVKILYDKIKLGIMIEYMGHEILFNYVSNQETQGLLFTRFLARDIIIEIVELSDGQCFTNNEFIKLIDEYIDSGVLNIVNDYYKDEDFDKCLESCNKFFDVPIATFLDNLYKAINKKPVFYGSYDKHHGWDSMFRNTLTKLMEKTPAFKNYQTYLKQFDNLKSIADFIEEYNVITDDIKKHLSTYFQIRKDNDEDIKNELLNIISENEEVDTFDNYTPNLLNMMEKSYQKYVKPSMDNYVQKLKLELKREADRQRRLEECNKHKENFENKDKQDQVAIAREEGKTKLENKKNNLIHEIDVFIGTLQEHIRTIQEGTIQEGTLQIQDLINQCYDLEDKIAKVTLAKEFKNLKLKFDNKIKNKVNQTH